MVGYIVKHLGRVYKIGTDNEDFSVSSCIVREEFILEGGSISFPFISSYQKLREGLEFEFEVAEFEEASEPLSEYKNPVFEIDSEYTKMMEEIDSDWNLEWAWKLKKFREMEAILIEEGIIEHT